jgi:hypothetical protein
MRLVTVGGRPHSGTTWLARILAEACDGTTPVGGGRQSGGSGWRIVRTHSDPPADGSILVLMRRDPRDVLVSWHNRHGMVNPRGAALDLCATWTAMLDRWRAADAVETSYEALRTDGVAEVMRLALAVFGLELDDEAAARCLAAYQPENKNPRPVGAWRDDLEPGLARLIEREIGTRMEKEGYALGSI